MRFYFIILILVSGLNLSAVLAGEQVTNKIYLRELATIQKFNPLLPIIEKNIYDVIFETKKYELYLLDLKGRNSVFVTNYERLTVDLREQEVQVTLSNKMVVIRRYEGTETPILDLRLALYELFFGKDYVTKNKSQIEANSKSRMERLKKLALMQEQIKKNETKDASPKNVSDKQIKNPSISKDLIKTKTVTPLTNLSSEEKTPSISNSNTNIGRLNPSINNSANMKSNTAIPNKPKDSTSLNKENKEVVYKNQEKKIIASIPQLPPPRKKSEIKREPQRNFILTTSFGFIHYKASYTELVSANTNLNFYSMGIKAQSRLLESHSGNFFNQLDYELSLELLQPLATDEFQAPKGKKIATSIMSSHRNEGMAGGIFFSYENLQLVTLRGVNQGLELVDINFLFSGPEVHLDFSKGSYNFNLSARYKFGLLGSSSFEAEYKANGLAIESAFYAYKHWGLNLKFEKTSISSARKRSAGKANADLAQITLSYKFN